MFPPSVIFVRYVGMLGRRVQQQCLPVLFTSVVVFFAGQYFVGTILVLSTEKLRGPVPMMLMGQKMNNHNHQELSYYLLLVRRRGPRAFPNDEGRWARQTGFMAAVGGTCGS